MGIAKRIIPCLDVDNGRVVKGVKFLNIRDAGDPVEVAKRYDEQGADEIASLDITASSDNRKTLVSVVEKVASQVFIPLTVGGGIRNISDIKNMLKAGADKVSINTAAVKNPDFVRDATKQVGSQCIVVAIDTKDNSRGNWEVYSHGGTKNTNKNALDWAREVEKLGAGELLVTSMDRDGTKKGFDNDLLKKITDSVNIPVIASGGAGKPNDFKDAIIIGGVSAVLAASVFHFGELKISAVKEYLVDNNIPMRL